MGQGKVNVAIPPHHNDATHSLTWVQVQYTYMCGFKFFDCLVCHLALITHSFDISQCVASFQEKRKYGTSLLG